MNKSDIFRIMSTYGNEFDRHFPSVLMGFGTALFGLTIFELVKTAPKASKKLEEVKDEPHVEKAKVIFKEYKKPIAYGIGALGCFYGAHDINNKRLIALASAYSIKDMMFDNYTQATEEIVGKNKAKKIQSAASEKSLQQSMERGTVIENATYGDDLFYFEEIDKPFRCDMEHLIRAFDEASSYMSTNEEVSVNYILHRLGLRGLGEIGDKNGFRLETIFKRNGYNPGKCQILKREDIIFGAFEDKPCGIIPRSIKIEPLSGWDCYNCYDGQFRY